MNPVWRQFLATPKNRQILIWVGIVFVALAAGAWAVGSVGAEGAAKLLDAVARLFGALIWPIAFLYLLVRFGSSIGDFITNSVSEITLKGVGFEASMKRRQTEVATALTAANVSALTTAPTPREEGSTPEAAEKVAWEAAEATRRATVEATELAAGINVRTIQQIEGSKVLWVDDRPENNNHERQALEATGVRFAISTSTEDALEKLKTQRFDVIISDMGRPPDNRAGYTLLNALRSAGNQTPYIIYAGSRAPEHQMEARSRGAIGCTNRPTELFQMVLSVLQHDAVRS
jgi:CheY-like chemotaxis protein